MPIIQISQIKHRRGLRNDIPNPSLEEAELGFSVDSGELFIGSPNFPPAMERAAKNEFPYANTQILTEWSDNVKNLLRYKYLDRKIDFKELSAEFVPTSALAFPFLQYNTGVSSKSITIVRKLQEKLDEYVSVKDYGAQGDGKYNSLIIFNPSSPEPLPSNAKMNAETAALRRAILDVYNTNIIKNEIYGFHPKKLYFPAGVYHINNSLPIPPYSHWVGDGKRKTIIALSSSVSTFPEFECLAFTVDGKLSSTDSNNDSVYLNHSYQNISLNSLPEYIVLENITFVLNFNPVTSSRYYDVIRFIAAKNIYLKNCEFIGNWSVPYIGPISTAGMEWKSNTNSHFYHHDIDTVCLVFDSLGNINVETKPRNILIENCEIGNSVYGCVLTDDINDICFKNNVFNRLYRGISLNDNLPVSAGSVFGNNTAGLRGPQNVISVQNIFRNIKREAEVNFATKIFNSSNQTNTQNYDFSYLVSLFNRFENVGYNITNDGNEYYIGLPASANPVYPAVNFESSIKNISIGDTFERAFEEEKITSPIEIGNKPNSRIYAKERRKNLIVNSCENDTIQRKLILSANTNIFSNTGIRFLYENANTAYISYSINVSAGGNSIQRIGNAEIIINETDVIFNEDYSEVGGNTNIELSAFAGNPVELRFKNPNSNNATMNFEIKWYKN